MNLREKAGRAFEFIRRRRNAYQLKFPKATRANDIVLMDIANFCRARKSCWSDDPRHEARLLGRQEVWLRFAQHLNLTTEELFEITTGYKFDAATRVIIEKENEYE